jgi:hypothetical protein
MVTLRDVAHDMRPGGEERRDAVRVVVDCLVLREVRVLRAERDDAGVLVAGELEARDRDVVDIRVHDRELTAEVDVAEDTEALGAAETGLARRHRRSDAHQLEPVLLDHHILAVTAEDEDRVARVRAVDCRLNRLALADEPRRSLCGTDPAEQ